MVTNEQHYTIFGQKALSLNKTQSAKVSTVSASVLSALFLSGSESLKTSARTNIQSHQFH